MINLLGGRLRYGDRDERGSGLLGSVIGVAIVAAMIGLVANVALGLWIRSTVDSVAYDAARRVATADPPDATSPRETVTEDDALEGAKAMLGPYRSRVSMEFIDSGDPDYVALRVRSPGTSLMPRMFSGTLVVGRLDRVIMIRREGSPSSEESPP
ncbi:MAG: hypothetical protein V9F03_12500 [Microthrixaceae bacterium]